MGHWYDSNNQLHTHVPKKTEPGKLREATLADARKNKWYPSVTAITSIPSKSNLDKWKIGKLFEIIGEYRHIVHEHKEGWENQLLALTEKKKSVVPKRGDDLHAAIERVLKRNGKVDRLNQDEVFVEPVIEYMKQKYSLDGWTSELSFTSVDYGFGGKIDCHHRDKKILIDFKSKDTESLANMELYDDYSMQLAAYRLGVCGYYEDCSTVDWVCRNIFLSNTKKGEIKEHIWVEDSLVRGERMFLHLLEYWKLANNYLV